MKKIIFVFFVIIVVIFLTADKKEKDEDERESKWRIAVHYVVKNGDSVWEISRRFKILEWHLRQENGLVKGEIIRPGQTLRIPLIEWKPYEGKASWYGPGFEGKPLANGEKLYDPDEILVAHRFYPFGLKLKITNTQNGKSIVAKVLDRGPYAKDEKGNYSREIDLSLRAAKKLGAVKPGEIPVKIEPIVEISFPPSPHS